MDLALSPTVARMRVTGGGSESDLRPVHQKGRGTTHSFLSLFCYVAPMTVEIDIYADVQPWDRQPGETDAEWRYFQAYRNLGPARTIGRAAESLELTTQTLTNISSKNQWRQRVQAYDYWQDQIFLREQAEYMRTVGRRQAEQASQTLEALMKPVQAILMRMETDPSYLADLTAMDVKQLIKLAQASARTLPGIMQAERLAIGAPTQITKHEGTIKHEHRDADPARLAELIGILGESTLLSQLTGEGGVGDFIEAEVIEVDSDESDTETASLPFSTSD